jgi:hypothetical protein
MNKLVRIAASALVCYALILQFHAQLANAQPEVTWEGFVVGGITHLIASTDSVARAFAYSEGKNEFKIQREWRDVHGCYWWTDSTSKTPPIAIISFSNRTELYAVGQLDNPLLTHDDGLPLDIAKPKSLGLRQDGRLSGIAVKSESQTSGVSTNESRPEWIILQPLDDGRWSRVELSSALPLDGELFRVGNATFAASHDGQWHIFTGSSNQWTDAHIAGLPPVINKLRGTGRWLFGVSASEKKRHEDIFDWDWFLQDQSLQWQSIHDLVHDLTGSIIEGVPRDSKGRGVEFRVGDDHDSDQHRFFFVRRNGVLRPITETLQEHQKEIDDFDMFHDGRIIALRSLPRDQSNSAFIGWQLFLGGPENRWKPASEKGLAVLGQVWGIEDFGQNVGVGVQSLDVNNSEQPFIQQWFVEQQDGHWVTLKQLVPAISSYTISRVETDGLKTALAVRIAGGSNQQKWYVLFKRGGIWKLWDQMGGQNTKIANVEADWEADVLRVVNSSNREALLVKAPKAAGWQYVGNSPLAWFGHASEIGVSQ